VTVNESFFASMPVEPSSGTWTSFREHTLGQFSKASKLWNVFATECPSCPGPNCPPEGCAVTWDSLRIASNAFFQDPEHPKAAYVRSRGDVNGIDH